MPKTSQTTDSSTTTRVLVVDDSITMRAMISGTLERIPNVEIVGMANGADDARRMVAALHPDVMTLDVEMPGMGGMEYLAEIMATRPMPVIMFSSRTEAGAEISIEALRLGASDCLPKPRVASAADLDKVIANLARRIRHAAASQRPIVKADPAPTPSAPFAWNGRLVAIGGDMSSTKALFDLLASFPVACPPTLVVQHLAAGLSDAMIAKLDGKVPPKVVLASEGMPVEPGHVYVAPPGDRHMAIDGWPGGRLRMLTDESVDGECPSIALLFGSVATAAAGQAVGMLLTTHSEDGERGMRALRAAGSYGVAPSGRGFTLSHNLITQPLASEDVARTVLTLCSR